MKRTRPPQKAAHKTAKKTESLEVRVPHAVKRDFMARTQARGRTASAVLREFIDAYLAGAGPSEERSTLKRLATPAAATAVIATVVAAHVMTPTAASAAPNFKSVFDQLDRDKDGKLSADELAGHPLLADEAYARHQADLGSGVVPIMVAVHSGVHQLVHGSAAPEMKAHMQATFASLDGDKNGAVTFGEFESHHLSVLRKAFDGMDSNQDGKIGQAELDTAIAHMPQGVAAAHPVSFAQLDHNRDGGISWEEFLG
jgi:Ca2+-binding EF-hand superfamily protein